jgi:hypothetical protein
VFSGCHLEVLGGGFWVAKDREGKTAVQECSLVTLLTELGDCYLWPSQYFFFFLNYFFLGSTVV